MIYRPVILVLSLTVHLAGGVIASDIVDFDRQILPLLASRCLDCHNSADRKGELDLSASKAALRELEPVIVPRKYAESILWQLVDDESMPPDEPLSDHEKSLLMRWIDQGAKWGSSDPINRFAISTEHRAGVDWWSLQPVKRPQVPIVDGNEWAKGPIDSLILAKLHENNLEHAEPADRQTLIRRVTFDLIGLPPTPNEIEDFVHDARPDAYELLVDRLLDSKHYGERWARHWLDIARFTESQGFEYDRFRPNAWPYRDYVIDSFNADKPYNLFLQEQIAGDVTNFADPQSEVTSEGIVATSLLVCGPWDQAGNAQANVTQRMITREEELEDLVSVIGQSILGMTINCARCHTHKFDPIPQEDYYRFKSVFEGIWHGERSIETPTETAARERQLAQVENELASIEKRIADMETEARARLAVDLTIPSALAAEATATPVPYAKWSFAENANDEMGKLDGELMNGAEVREGRLVLNGENQFMKTAPLELDVQEKSLEAWISLPILDQAGGGVFTIQTLDGAQFDSIVYAERQSRKWIAGSNGFIRTRDLDAERETSTGALVHIAIVYRANKSIELFRNGERYAEPYQVSALQDYKAADCQLLFGLRHSGAANGYFSGELESAAFYAYALTEAQVAASFAAGADGRHVSREQMLSAMSDLERANYNIVVDQANEHRQLVRRLAEPRLAYVGVRKQPEPSVRLLRGDVTKPAEVVSPAPLSAISLPSSQSTLQPNSPEAERRVQLARWLTDRQQPLTARVLVNRLWHYHFGHGIVHTPNDFGFNGARPTHPELLDWLAAEFLEGPHPWSIKHMHRLIVNSATYRQTSTLNPQAAAVDADNTLLWRYAPRRLEGEIVRDAMLAVSGDLNPALGGPSFMPFIVTNFNSDFYQPIDPIGPEFNRRTIYRANINSGKSAMLDALDCPEPSIKTPVRRVTTTPLAALALMNNSFVQRQAKRLSQRMESETRGEPSKAIRRAYLICFGRSPSDVEIEQARALVSEQGLEAFCWAMLNASEFMYVN